jgi:hypothetical protein
MQHIRNQRRADSIWIPHPMRCNTNERCAERNHNRKPTNDCVRMIDRETADHDQSNDQTRKHGQHSQARKAVVHWEPARITLAVSSHHACQAHTSDERNGHDGSMRAGDSQQIMQQRPNKSMVHRAIQASSQAPINASYMTYDERCCRSVEPVKMLSSKWSLRNQQ